MTAEPFVLIPGLLCTRALYGPQIAAFSQDRDILVGDHTRDDTMAAIARRVLAAAPERFALAGLSMGGYIALEIMHAAPERVTRLALLDTNARPDAEAARAERLRLIGLAESGRLSDVHEVLWPRFVHPARRDDPELKRIVLAMAQDTGAEAFVRQERAIMGRRDSRPRLASLEIPVLVLVGEEDELTPPAQAREMAGLLPRATLVEVPECGHLSTLEAPEAVNRALAAWLSA